MIRFRDFQNIYVGLIVLLIYIIFFTFYLYRRKKNIDKLDAERNIFLGRNNWQYGISFIFTALAIIFLTIAFMRPQTKSSLKRVNIKSENIVFALDLSASMHTRDILPDRLSNAKTFIRRIVSQFKTENIALVVFAGEALIQCPFTTDYNTFLELLQFADSRNIGLPGTNLAGAINRSLAYIKGKFLKNSIIVLLSDGESFQGDIDSAIAASKKAGVIIYTVGVGTPNGEPVPIYNDKQQITGYKKDRYGNIVVSKLNSERLKKIASSTGGKYFEIKAGSFDEVKFLNEIARLKRSTNKNIKRYEYEEQYHIFLFFAFFLLLLDMLTPIFFKLRSRLLLIFLLFIMFAFSKAGSGIKEGNKYYRAKDYYRAIGKYSEALRADTHNAAAIYNIGCALYKGGFYDTAIKAFSAVHLKSKKQAEAYYNLGDAYFKIGKFSKALKSYVKSLIIEPSDTSVKYNLEVTLRKIKASKGKGRHKKQKNGKKQKQQQDRKALKKLLSNYDKNQKLQKQKTSRRTRVEYDW